MAENPPPCETRSIPGKSRERKCSLSSRIWLWWIGGERHLSKREMASLDELPAEQRPFISDISLWEVALLIELGRWNVAIPFESWLKAACHPRTVEILPISQDIAAEIARLPATFHRDPADRIIVSTAGHETYRCSEPLRRAQK